MFSPRIQLHIIRWKAPWQLPTWKMSDFFWKINFLCFINVEEIELIQDIFYANLPTYPPETNLLDINKPASKMKHTTSRTSLILNSPLASPQ